MENNQLTQSELKELLHYDKDTGVFTWLVAKSGRVKIGSIAGSTAIIWDGKSYRVVVINGKHYRAHRLAFLYVLGRFPVDEADHIDGCGTNNKWLNLREVSRIENNKNKRRQVNNTSGICGVSWDKSRMLWIAYVKVNSKLKHLGRYANISDAINARKSAEIEYGFHKNHGTNRPL